MQISLRHSTDQGWKDAQVGDELTELQRQDLRRRLDVADLSRIKGPIKREDMEGPGNQWFIKITGGGDFDCEGKIPDADVPPPLREVLNFMMLYGNRKVATEAACERLHFKLCTLRRRKELVPEFSRRLITMIEIGQRKGYDSLAEMRREAESIEAWLNSNVTELDRALSDYTDGD